MNTPFDIFFSNYPHSWGWATWRNRWSLFSFRLPNEEHNFNVNKYDFLDKESKKYWLDIFRKTQAGTIDAWDYQWFHTLWRNQGVSIIPKYNLVTNIGFGDNATNTTEKDDRFSKLITCEFELSKFPHEDDVNLEFDVAFFNTYLRQSFKLKTLLKRIIFLR
jgi:hypothetical protein